MHKIIWLPRHPKNEPCPFRDDELAAFNDIAQRTLNDGRFRELPVHGYNVTAVRKMSHGDAQPKCDLRIVRGNIGIYAFVSPSTRGLTIMTERLPPIN